MSYYTAATTTVDSTNHWLHFDTDGYYMIGDSDWGDITFIASITYNGGTIGIAPRVYEDNMYMTFSMANKEPEDDGLAPTEAVAKLDAQITDNEIHLANTSIGVLTAGTTYTIKAIITGTNYKVYVDNTLIFNIEYSSMARGRVGIYATSNNTCSSIEVQSAFPDGWISNISSILGGIVDIKKLDNDDIYLHLNNTGANALYAEQVINVTGGDYALSFNASGTGGLAQIIELNGATPSTYELAIPYGDWSPHMLMEMLHSDCTQIKVRFSVTNAELSVNNVQFEKNSFATSYIHNESTTSSATRGASVITFPSKDNINQAQGTVSMWVMPVIDHASVSINPTLFEYGDANGVIRLSYEGGAFKFKYGTDDANSVSYAAAFTDRTWFHIVGQWSSSTVSLYVNDVITTKAINEYVLNNNVDTILFGNSYRTGAYQFNGIIDETIVYKDVISSADISTLYSTTETVPDNTSMILRATFNYAVGNFNKSWIEATPAPQYGSPVIVEKEDGTPLNKVSFFDSITGEYRTWNEEQITYDGVSDYVTVSYQDIDDINFKIGIKDINGVLYGTNYRVDGHRIYHNFTQDEKKELAGQILLVSYQVNSVYTVDFNIDIPDSFRVNIGKYNGEPLSIYYEGNDFQTEKLATMIELNPLLNPNHEGFLYITNNIEKVTAFRVKATPDDLPANGVSEAIVIVEPLDSYGNFISHLQLDVSAEKGTIIPAYDKDSILLRERAGRYIYRYTAPNIKFADSGILEEEDRINVIDTDTGLGIQTIITLTTLQDISHVIESGDTLQSLADKYGATENDIITGNPSITNVESYITANVGRSINVPINYSSELLTKTREEITEEPMLGYLANELCKYMDMKADDLPNGLGSLLDFNGDGLINIDEVVWLSDNKLTNNISSKYTAVKEWEINNAG